MFHFRLGGLGGGVEMGGLGDDIICSVSLGGLGGSMAMGGLGEDVIFSVPVGGLE